MTAGLSVPMASRVPKEVSSSSSTAPLLPEKKHGPRGLLSPFCLPRGTSPLTFFMMSQLKQSVLFSVQYDVCYIEIPNRSFNDAQLNGEYVAAAIQILAPQSKNGKLFIVGHSQGNIVRAPGYH